MNNFYEKHLGSMRDIKNLQMSFTMNDKGDILIRIKPFKKPKDSDGEVIEFADNEPIDPIDSCSFFFYVPNPKSSNQEFIYFDS